MQTTEGREILSILQRGVKKVWFGVVVGNKEDGSEIVKYYKSKQKKKRAVQKKGQRGMLAALLGDSARSFVVGQPGTKQRIDSLREAYEAGNDPFTVTDEDISQVLSAVYNDPDYTEEQTNNMNEYRSFVKETYFDKRAEANC